jgi:hypothetical protein
VDSEAKRGELKRVDSTVRSNALAMWLPRIGLALVLLVLVAGALFALEG